MEIIRTIGKLNTEKKTAVAVGYFDGMHIGHQELIRQMLQCAKDNDLLPAILTFDMHTFRAAGKGKHDLFPRSYTTHLAEKAGVELYVDLPFEEIRVLEPDQFASAVLGEGFLHAAAVFCGDDFRYGKDRAGNVDDLRTEGEKNGFTANVVDSVMLDGEAVSTSRIKEHMKLGEIREANRMLGKPYSMYGEVIHGNHLAQGMGFPTANIRLPAEILSPRKGVYLTETIVDGVRYRSITNIGTRPTITDDIESTAETHILDFDQNLYGKRIRILFYDFIRPEQKFGSAEELKHMVRSNIEQARNALLE
ncbi:MAG: riboflavin biosynthesis protein RibF [Oscillospiraceae bacterium]|nr:riboflavin biosynthesis protein RibF [Oscillospiraceae bacterium]